MLTRLRNQLRYLLRGRRIDEDVARELEFHRDMLVEDEQRRGRSHEAAVLNARRRMGNTALMTEYARDAWIVAWFDALVRDVRYALRSFARYPAFTAVALLTLALGIGANAAIFRLVDTVLLRALPVRHPEQLVAVRATLSYWFFEQFRDRNTVFSDVIGTRALVSATLTSDDQSLGATTTELVTGNYFDVLGVTPVLGRRLMKRTTSSARSPSPSSGTVCGGARSADRRPCSAARSASAKASLAAARADSSRTLRPSRIRSSPY